MAENKVLEYMRNYILKRKSDIEFNWYTASWNQRLGDCDKHMGERELLEDFEEYLVECIEEYLDDKRDDILRKRDLAKEEHNLSKCRRMNGAENELFFLNENFIKAQAKEREDE